MIAEKLAEFAQAPVSGGPAMDVMRLSLLDWCAVGVAGQDEPVSKLVRALAEDEGGAPQASLIGSLHRVPARVAALVNGTISHALDYDDTHFAHIGHPSVAIVPAALAVAQISDVSGKAFQEAALIGAEASIRMGLWLGRSHYQAGFHQTATAGAFGACLAACRLLDLPRDKTVMALGLVSTRASGLKSQFGTMGKPMNAGIAAANGVEAALLAQRGLISNSAAPDGPQGFGPTHHGEANETAWEGLGSEWLFERVSHKFHACCHGLHAMLEALKPADIAPQAIERVTIETNPRWLSVCNNAAPDTGLEAKFSYRLTAALSLLGHDTARPGTFTDAMCRDPDILELRDKVQVTGTEMLSEMQTRVTVHLKNGDGQILMHDLDAPVPLADRTTRLRDKAASLLGRDRADAMWRLIRGGASPQDIACGLTN